MSRRDLAVPPIVLDPSSLVPLSLQIYRKIASAIRKGEIRRGARLPSTRWMARFLRVSRRVSAVRGCESSLKYRPVVLGVMASSTSFERRTIRREFFH